MYHTDEQLLEVFEKGGKTLPLTNLNPKQTPAQTFHISAEPSPIVLKLASSESLGEKIKPLKPGSKSLQVILFGLSDKGNLSELKHGLSNDPIGVIQTIIEVLISKVKESQLETIMFRFPAKKLKGREATIRKIIKTISKKRLPGYDTLDEIDQHCQKHAYVILYKKSKGLEAKGLPEPDSKIYTKEKTPGGEVYSVKGSKDKISKAEAIAATIATHDDKNPSDSSLMKQVKLDRNSVIASLYSSMTKSNNVVLDSDAQEQYDKISSAEVAKKVLNKPSDSQLAESLKMQLSKNDIITDARFTKLKETTSLSEDKIIEKLNLGYEILKTTTQQNSFNKILELYNSFDDLSLEDRKVIAKTCIYWLRKKIAPAINKFETKVPSNLLNSLYLYCDTGYSSINNYLNKGPIKPDLASQKSMIKAVNDLDKLFDPGTQLSKGTLLYRGMTIPAEQFNVLQETKQFYFKSFVSTSLYPMIFGGAFGMVNDVLAEPKELTEDDSYVVGFVISGADKINVVIPGSNIDENTEAEIILPRGLMLKIDSIKYHKSKALVEASVDIDNTIQESSDNNISNFKRLFLESKKEVDTSVLLDLLSQVPDKFK